MDQLVLINKTPEVTEWVAAGHEPASCTRLALTFP